MVAVEILGVMNLILILFQPFNVHGKEACICDIVKKKERKPL